MLHSNMSHDNIPWYTVSHDNIIQLCHVCCVFDGECISTFNRDGKKLYSTSVHHNAQHILCVALNLQDWWVFTSNQDTLVETSQDTVQKKSMFSEMN